MGANCSNLTYPDPMISNTVSSMMGARCLERNVVITTLVVYPLILVFGLLGNTFTCLLIAKNRSMHTATNYYLFSLAISDVLQLLLGLPFELSQSLTEQYPYNLPLFICKGRAYLTELMSYASILTITAFSVERWLAICFPLRVQIFSRLSRAVFIIVTVWIVAFSAAGPVAYFVTINRLPLPVNYTQASNPLISTDRLHIKNTEFCSLEFGNDAAKSAIINCSFWAFFLLPLITISLLYIHIAAKIREAVQKMKGSGERVQQESQKRLIKNRQGVVRMLVAVVLAFAICWLPYHAQRIMILYVDWENVTPSISNFYSLMFYLSGYFYYANSAVNPLLYSLLSRKFRTAFMEFFCPRRLSNLLGNNSSCSPTRPSRTGVHSNRSVGLPGCVSVSEDRRSRYGRFSHCTMLESRKTSSRSPLPTPSSLNHRTIKSAKSSESLAICAKNAKDSPASSLLLQTPADTMNSSFESDTLSTPKPWRGPQVHSRNGNVTPKIHSNPVVLVEAPSLFKGEEKSGLIDKKNRHLLRISCTTKPTNQTDPTSNTLVNLNGATRTFSNSHDLTGLEFV